MAEPFPPQPEPNNQPQPRRARVTKKQFGNRGVLDFAGRAGKDGVHEITFYQQSEGLTVRSLMLFAAGVSVLLTCL